MTPIDWETMLAPRPVAASTDATLTTPLKAKVGAWDRGGSGWRTVGVISDAINAAFGNGRTPYADAIRQGELDDREDQRVTLANELARLKIAAEMTPRAPEPTNTERTYNFLNGVNPEWGRSYLENMATAPPVVQKNADGTTTLYPQGSIPRAPAAGLLQQLPPGVKPYSPGGATPSGSRTFR